MATRTNDLTESAKLLADDLAQRCGTLKQILSAGVIALYDMTPKMREFYMARAAGKELESKPESSVASENEIYADLAKLAEDFRAVDEKIRRSESAKQKKDALHKRDTG